ncbi:MAG: metallophosphoesterase family protein [Bacteroidales bacterium]|jgi:putative phosphoesterase
MHKIGLLSDTHGWLHPDLFEFFGETDEIWHAGDIGSMEVAKKLALFKPLKAVYGNIDGGVIRKTFKEVLEFRTEGVDVIMTHIGGTPGRYNHKISGLISSRRPDLFVCGHSHIAKVARDPKTGFLYVNPGAAGYHGFHKYMTAIRFVIDGTEIRDMEIIELGERGKAIKI